MLLSARMLDSVNGVNSYEQVSCVRYFEGDAPAVYFMLIDLSLDRAEAGYMPSGRRYVPAAGATLSVLLDNLDDARKCSRAATQPFAQDLSIWCVQLLPSDSARGTINLKMILTEPTRTLNGFVPAAIRVSAGSNLDSSAGFTGGTIPTI